MPKHPELFERIAIRATLDILTRNTAGRLTA